MTNKQRPTGREISSNDSGVASRGILHIHTEESAGSRCQTLSQRVSPQHHSHVNQARRRALRTIRAPQIIHPIWRRRAQQDRYMKPHKNLRSRRPAEAPHPRRIKRCVHRESSAALLRKVIGNVQIKTTPRLYKIECPYWNSPATIAAYPGVWTSKLPIWPSLQLRDDNHSAHRKMLNSESSHSKKSMDHAKKAGRQPDDDWPVDPRILHARIDLGSRLRDTRIDQVSSRRRPESRPDGRGSKRPTPNPPQTL